MVKLTTDTPQRISLSVTLVVCVLIFLWLVFTNLDFTPIQRMINEGPHISMEEIEVEEEFVEVEVHEIPPVVGHEDAAPALTPEKIVQESQSAPQSGVNQTTQGKVEHPTQTITTPKPSPVKIKQEPTPPKPAAAVANPQEDAKKTLAQQTNNKVANAFAKPENKNNAQSGIKDDQQAGSDKGNPNSSASPNSKGAKPGVTVDLPGGQWKFPNYSTNIQSNNVGSVTFSVDINEEGKVVKVSQKGVSALDKGTIAKCKAEIEKHNFTYIGKSDPIPARATVTFTFVDPK